MLPLPLIQTDHQAVSRKLRSLRNRLNDYTLWAFNPQPQLQSRRRMKR